MILRQTTGSLIPMGVYKHNGTPAPLPGELPHLTVTSDAGSIVSASDGTVTTFATETSPGTFEMDLPEWGKTYTVYSTLDGETVSDTITIDDVDYDIEISYLDPTKMEFTEEEFLKILAAGRQSEMQIGALITLSNQYCDTYEVIGVNHDGTSGTVDIMSHTQVYNATDVNTWYAASSREHSWLNGTYLNAFNTEVKNAAKNMNIVSSTFGNGSETLNTITAKVKILSMTEIGATYVYNGTQYASTKEGSFYTGAFTAGDRTANATRWRAKGSYGNNSYYYLRSSDISGYTGGRFSVNTNGSCSYSSTSGTSKGIVAVLRF